MQICDPTVTVLNLMQIYYSYVKKRKDFGKHAAFTAQEADVRSPGLRSRSSCSSFDDLFAVNCASCIRMHMQLCPCKHSTVDEQSAPQAPHAHVPVRPCAKCSPMLCLQVLFDLRPNEEYAQEHIERNPGSVAMQAGCDVSAHEANTDAVVYADSGMVHTEGGWPKEVDSTEAESVIRFKKKVRRDAVRHGTTWSVGVLFDGGADETPRAASAASVKRGAVARTRAPLLSTQR